jgi:hypothetical protein
MMWVAVPLSHTPLGGGGGGFASQLGMGCSVVCGTCCPVHVRLTFTSEKWQHSWVCCTGWGDESWTAFCRPTAAAVGGL